MPRASGSACPCPPVADRVAGAICWPTRSATRERRRVARDVMLEVRPTSRFSARVAVGRTSCDRLALGAWPQQTAHAALLSDILAVVSASPLVPRADLPRLREELSETELRVLRYLPSNLSAPEIASELYVSTSTIKTHLRRIYAKLDLHKRTQVVERARALGLLGRSSRGER